MPRMRDGYGRLLRRQMQCETATVALSINCATMRQAGGAQAADYRGSLRLHSCRAGSRHGARILHKGRARGN